MHIREKTERERSSNLGLSVCSLGGHPERRAKPEVEGSLVSKGDPSTPPRCGSAQDDRSKQTAKLQFTSHLIIALYSICSEISPAAAPMVATQKPPRMISTNQ